MWHQERVVEQVVYQSVAHEDQFMGRIHYLPELTCLSSVAWIVSYVNGADLVPN